MDLFAAFAGYLALLSPLEVAPAPKVEGRAMLASAPPATRDAPAPIIDTHTLSRPIFSRTRRPAPSNAKIAAADEGPARPERPLPSGASVRAIVIRGDERRMFVVCDAFAQGRWFKEGETFEHWRIVRIRDLAATVESDGRSLQLTLDYASKETLSAHRSATRPASSVAVVPVSERNIREIKGIRG
jgi:hypothetical protein